MIQFSIQQLTSAICRLNNSSETAITVVGVKKFGNLIDWSDKRGDAFLRMDQIHGS